MNFKLSQSNGYCPNQQGVLLQGLLDCARCGRPTSFHARDRRCQSEDDQLELIS
jgi:hypothetical protein